MKNDTASPLINQAERLHALGISLVPVIGKEVHLSWSWFNHERMGLQRLLRFPFTGIAGINGRVSGNLITLDYETPDSFEDGLKDCWQWCGPTWATRTRRGGHIRYRLPYPVKGEQVLRQDGKLVMEARGQQQYALLAPSAHPEGGFYEDITPPESLRLIEDIPFLALSPAGITPRIPRLARLLYYNHEKTIKRYASASEATMAFICSLLSAGFDESFIESALDSSVWYNSYQARRKESPQTAKNWLQLSIQEARLHLTEINADFEAFIKRWKRLLDSQEWRGVTGNTDYKVTLAIAHLAETGKRTTLRPSLRRLAELATTRPITVSTSLRRIQRAGMIAITPPKKRGDMLSLTLTAVGDKNATLSHDAEASSTNVIKCDGLVTFYLSCWESCALGASARLVYETLLHSPCPDYKTIAEKTTKSLRTIKRAMPRLLELNLVIETHKGYEANESPDWQELARWTGGAEKSEKRKQRHITDREDRKKKGAVPNA